MLQFRERARVSREPLAGCDALMSQLLRARGIDTAEKAEAFLNPDLDRMTDPFSMPGMRETAALIRGALADGKKIAVYGDYDCDGVCASAILLETLRELGADVVSYIPDRHAEGYGVNGEAVRKLHAEGCGLLVTVDCGISNLPEVMKARRLGLAVAVTDHHHPGPELPEADALVNPELPGTPPALRHLCGAGVALKLSEALAGREAALERLDLAALATVSDIVPLMGENRIIVANGLKRMTDSPRPGLKALMAAAEITPPVNENHLGYRLGPRINAAGRLAHARDALNLLTTRDPAEAEALAMRLNTLNRERQTRQAEITAQAEAMMAAETDFRDDRCIIVRGEGWESGVVGLAAGKLCEKYHWPAIVLSSDPETGKSVGSCRSIPGVNIFEALSACKDLFDRFGGHEMAAGLTIPTERIPELRRRLNAFIAERCDPAAFVPVLEYDAVLPLEQVKLATVDAVSRLSPCGEGNPPPVFLITGAQVGQCRRVGATGDHLKLSLTDGTHRAEGIGFGLGDLADLALERVDALFALDRNEFNGRVTAQMQVQALRPSAGSEPIPPESLLFRSLLQEIGSLAENSPQIPAAAELHRAREVRERLRQGLGTCVIAHDPERARELLGIEPAPDVPAEGKRPDRRGFCTVLFHPTPDMLSDQWQTVVLADGDVLPGEAAMAAARCPRAALWTLPENDRCRQTLKRFCPDLPALRALVLALQQGAGGSLVTLRQACGQPEETVLLGMRMLEAAGLAEFSLSPWRAVRTAVAKADPTATPLWRYLADLIA